MSQTATVPPAVNKPMKWILRSPAHGLVSKTILLISFIGRKSGRSFATPVSYSQEGEQVMVFTHAHWWKNLEAGRPVKLRIQGKDRQGIVELVAQDKRAIAIGLAAHLRRVPTDARWYGVTLDSHGDPNEQEVENAVKTVVMIRLHLC